LYWEDAQDINRFDEATTMIAAAVLLLAASVPGPGFDPDQASAGEVGGVGLAIRAAKIITLKAHRPVIDGGMMLVRDGRIEAVGERAEIVVPADYEAVDVGDNWLMPGMIDLHSHIGQGGGAFENLSGVNDSVFLTNPGLRASSLVRADNPLFRRGVAGGVTSVLFIPGSGSNIGGQGVLLKIGRAGYEAAELRNPGSLKLAQAGNPEGWTVGVGRSFMNWNTRNTLRRGRAYADAWTAWRAGSGPQPGLDPQFEVFRDLFAGRTQVSTHTQGLQVVLMTIMMVKVEFGLDVYIDHGSFDGYRTAELAEEQGVPAILGPRAVSVSIPRFVDQDGAVLGLAAQYQARGHTAIGFNTDCVNDGTPLPTRGGALSIPPQEELSLQAAMAVRYGLEDDNLASIRGLTIVPARAAGLEHRLGSLEVGKDADILVLTGHPVDPRVRVERVFTDGREVYNADRDGQRW
jgi:imidazolonepropionase-like amidohydrolase